VGAGLSDDFNGGGVGRGGGSLASELGGLRQGQVLGDESDCCANGVLVLSEAFEHEDAAVDVHAEAVTLPVLGVDLFAGEAELAAFIDVPENAEAELDWMEDASLEGAESVFGLFHGDGACQLVSDTFLVGGGPELGLGLKGKTGAAVDFAVRCEDVGGGKHLHQLGGSGLVVLVSLVLPAEVVGVGDEIVDATLLGFGFGWCQRLVVDGNQAAEGTVVDFDDVFFPEVTAGAVGALLGDVEEVRPLLSRGDFIGGHLFDEAGLLRPCGRDKQSEGEGDSYCLRAKGSTERLRGRET